MKPFLCYPVVVILLMTSCSLRPIGSFQADHVPRKPNYAETQAWAALPFTRDSADVVPDVEMLNRQENAQVDAFYIYPTTYTGKKGQKSWNADVYDAHLNERTDRSAIRNQATVFNGACKVYAPRYRQAHLHCFYTQRKEADAGLALQLAYRDVREAFLYYLEHHNDGRPLIIAAHSQGTLHAAQLIREFYDDGREDMPPLVVAYLIGMPVEKDYFKTLPPCRTASDTHCFCSWRTVHEKYRPSRVYPVGDNYAVTNPLTWTPEKSEAPRELHAGAVLTRFYEGLHAGLMDAWTDNGLLRVTRPKIPGVPVMLIRNYHIADYNLFYANIRENVAERVRGYFNEEDRNAGK